MSGDISLWQLVYGISFSPRYLQDGIVSSSYFLIGEGC